MDKKYEILLDDAIEYEGKILYRIRALITFVDINDNIINAGELGGYIENEDNLSQEDKAWVYDKSKVYGDTIIRNSIINNSTINNSTIKDSIIVDSDIRDSTIEDSTIDDSIVEYVTLENSDIRSSTIVDSFIRDSVLRESIIKNSITIKDRRLTGEIAIPFKDIFKHQCKNRMLTAILTEDDKILYSIGCQKNITEKEFIDRIYNDDGGLEKNPHREEYLRLIPLINIYFLGELK